MPVADKGSWLVAEWDCDETGEVAPSTVCASSFYVALRCYRALFVTSRTAMLSTYVLTA